NGKILKQGRRDLQDNAFLSSATGYPPNEPLRYEKRMLDDWLQDEFGLAKK
ncbi:MAG: DUF3016 domain-containing protein, partial [Verrucomicrobiota bacterium]|nr:DUF3016 domain-containing protein [Verrucomicrobiota bacterium]